MMMVIIMLKTMLMVVMKTVLMNHHRSNTGFIFFSSFELRDCDMMLLVNILTLLVKFRSFMF